MTMFPFYTKKTPTNLPEEILCFPGELKVIIGLKWINMNSGTEIFFLMMTPKKKILQRDPDGNI